MGQAKPDAKREAQEKEDGRREVLVGNDIGGDHLGAGGDLPASGIGVGLEEPEWIQKARRVTLMTQNATTELWPQFSGEDLYESLINHYAFDIEEQQSFEDWIRDERGIEDPENITNDELLFSLFKEWAAQDEEWVGAFSAYRANH